MPDDKNRLVVAPGGWHETIPDWLLEEVKAERLMRGFAEIGGMFKNDSESEKVGYAEACVYLYTFCNYAPPSRDYVEIYIWLTGKMLQRESAPQNPEKFPDFMEEKLEEGLTEDEKRKLDELRRDLYRNRGGEIDHPVINATKAVFGTAEEREKKDSARKTAEKLSGF